MRNYPVLATKNLPIGDGYRVARTMRVEGGLHQLGEQRPYFSLVYTAHRKGFPNQCYSGGAGHDFILQHFPKFADLAALHLCDENGAPMHAEANGWYKLAGALGGMGEKYHAGNSQQNFPCVPPVGAPWKNTEYRQPTQAECLQIFAEHCRIPLAEAETFVASLALPNDNLRAGHAERVRTLWSEFVETLRPRWKAEAEACITNHNLQVFKTH